MSSMSPPTRNHPATSAGAVPAVPVPAAPFPAPPVPATPFPAPPLALPGRSSRRAPDGSPPTPPGEPGESRPPAPAIHGLYDALAAARELTLTSVRLTRHLGRGEDLELVSDLRRSTAGVALGLETRTARSLLTSLHGLWCASDLIDQAERRGLLSLEQALELLALGSRVEIPLMAFLRRCGLEIVVGPEEPGSEGGSGGGPRGAEDVGEREEGR